MAKSNLKLVSPASGNRTVTPLRRPNSELRPREHLTEREVEKLIEVAKRNRWGQRDATMILIAFHHGLRASELCSLQWSDIEFETGTVHLRRAKGGATATHPLLGDELRTLRALRRDAKSPFVFVSERNAPFSVAGFAKLIERAGVEARLPFKAHPHSGTLAATLWLIAEPIPGPCKPISGIARSNRPFVMLSLRPDGSATSGAKSAKSVPRDRRA